MLKDTFKKLICLLCVFMLVTTNIMTVYAVIDENAVEEMSSTEENELTLQSLELYPNGEEAEQVVTLEGMMPEGAEAEVVDVSAESDAIAAYDITITDGNSEYQPGEENPILVEIVDPVITENENVELWHVLDNGEREQIVDFTLEDGKISFYATGFSVYEIVKTDDETDDPDDVLKDVVPVEITGSGWQKVNSVGSLENYTDGLLICSELSGSNGYFMTGNEVAATGAPNRRGIESTDQHVNDPDSAIADGAVKYFFEKSGSNYKIYCKPDENTKKYVHTTNKSLDFTSDSTQATAYTISANGSNWQLKNGNSWQINLPGNNEKIFVTGNTAHPISFWYYNENADSNDPFSLNDVSGYGLMAYTEGDSIGEGLVADGTTFLTKTYGVETRIENDASSRKTLFVTDNVDVTEWKFINTTEDQYKLYNESTQSYLKSDGSSLSVTSDTNEATAFKVIPNDANRTDSRKRIKLKDMQNDKFICLNDGAFSMGSTGTDLWFVKKTTLAKDQLITYTADRISVSDGERACNDQEIIIYTRVWNESAERYDFYAIDHDGSLKQCYAYGDKLMWMGDSINTLLWKFIVYTENDKETGYYDFQNIYSGKFLNPQFEGDDKPVLSNSKPGVLLPGRTYEVTSSGAVNYGEYYSKILSWDYDNYNYAAVSNSGSSNAVATSLSRADDYYFAVINKVQEDVSDNLHEVATVDNNEYGITLKMIDFANSENQNLILTGKKAKPAWSDSTAYNPTTGLLSTDLKENGYPETKISNGNGGNYSLVDLYAADQLQMTNHLFIQSIHDSSGYFEYDSCQNFATLRGGKNSNGIYNGTTKTYTYKDENEEDKTGYDFTVFRELGTSNDQNTKKTLDHGGFFPYNYIKAGNKSTAHPENLYYAVGPEMHDSDPRKYEELYSVDTATPNYYVGMELEAKFIQTPSGLDAWGHDVVFEFTGDDDFWLYVDGELVIDLGGIHSAVAGKVNFKTGVVRQQRTATTFEEKYLLDIFRDNFVNRYKAANGGAGPSVEILDAYLDKYFAKDSNGNYENIFKDYTEHTMTIFYMERGAGASNLHMRFNLSSVTPGNVIFAKELSSEEEGDLVETNFSDVQFPFQIMYQKNDPDDTNWYYLTDKTALDKPSVSYQFSTQTVRYVAEYKSPNADKTYESVFFVTPGKPLEINFPEDAMTYQIIECAVNRDIYDVSSDSVINHEDGETEGVVFTPDDQVVSSGNIADLKMQAAVVKELPTISLNNRIKKNSVQALDITKKLYNGKSKSSSTELFYDSPDDKTKEDKTTFNYRLYLSNGTSGELKLASLREYYVLDTEYKVCKWNPATLQFERYTPEAYPDGLYVYEMDDTIREAVVSHTSPYGSISYIPAGYTVRVPGLLAGTKFMVVERDYEIPTGYDLIDYECKTGYKILSSDENSNFTFKIKNLNWDDEASDDTTKLIAAYKGEDLQTKYVKEFRKADGNTGTITFDYEDSKIAVASADQYSAYEITLDKGDAVSATANPDNHTLTATYTWENASVGDKITVAVYDDNGNLCADKITDIVFPETTATFTFDETDAFNSFSVNKVTVNKGDMQNFELNTELDASYSIDEKYILDGEEYFLDRGSKKYKSAGTIRAGIDAQVIVNNGRGFGIRADKVWSDADFTNGHGNLYTAVYLDDTLLNGTIKCLKSPNTTVQYFFDELPAGKHLSDYSIYEVDLTNPVVDSDGIVTSYDEIRKLEKISGNPESAKIEVDAIDKFSKFTLRSTKIWPSSVEDGTVITVGLYDTLNPNQSGPDGEVQPNKTAIITAPDRYAEFVFDVAEDTLKAASRYQVYELTLDSETDLYTRGHRLDTAVIATPLPTEYTVSYDYGTAYKTNDNIGEENARKDTIKNTRKGGIEINLHKWNNTDAEDEPLAAGTFQLYRKISEEEYNQMDDSARRQLEEINDDSCPEGVKGYYKRTSTYISDNTGNVTVLYNFDTGSYMLKQTSSPSQYLGLEKPVFFEISEGEGGVYNLSEWHNPNDTDNDKEHASTDGKFWVEYDVAPESGVLTAIIDIYNKPYTFDVKKVDSVTGLALPGAVFELHREVMTIGGYAMEYNPMPGYESLTSARGTGIIPKIDNTLPQGSYYLKETSAPDDYEKMQDPIRFTVTSNGIKVDDESQFGVLKRTDSLDGSHVTYVISVPNTYTGERPEVYYFDIEKTILIDKYMHENGDPEQKFMFKVDRYALEDTEMLDLLESFYVTIGCNDHVDASFSIADSSDGRFSYNSSDHKVTVYYLPGEANSESYSFPADVRTGTQRICTKNKGIYRITEITDWSKTDYEFWKGSNRIKGNNGQPKEDGSVVLTVNSAEAEDIQTACFANSETEYAYLSSQAWAKNEIREYEE